MISKNRPFPATDPLTDKKQLRNWSHEWNLVWGWTDCPEVTNYIMVGICLLLGQLLNRSSSTFYYRCLFFFFRATSIYLAGPLESLTGTLNEHSYYLNPTDILSVTGSDGITNVLSPGKCLCRWTPPLSQSLVNPGEEQTSTCYAWLTHQMLGDCCYVRHLVKCLLLTVSLSCLKSCLGLVWGEE